MKMPIDQFLLPHERRYRFWEAIRNNNHKVFPLWPGRREDISSANWGMFDQDSDEESIDYLDESDAEVAFPLGAINQTTAVAVTSSFGQDRMDELLPTSGARIWTPVARYYLFDQLDPKSPPTARRPINGLRLLGDGEWIHYPGSLLNGHLVHWEFHPWEVGTRPMPTELRALWIG